jgi:glycosyltransferase involved in cell wall biosynthesis
MRCSVNVAFYNKIDNLKLILASLESQTVKDFEVVICDDGSREDVVNQIKEIQKTSPLTIRHVWQEDNGWQKNIILNKSIMSMKTDYIIFIDGDCIPDKRFVEAHLAARQKGFALSGRRINLSDKISKKLTPEMVKNDYFNRKFLYLLLSGETRHGEKMLYARIPFLARIIDNKHRDILGCNFSIYKEDLLEINGFDERFLSPGVGEDLDVYRRLLMVGKTTKSVVASALVYHLHHKETIIPQATWDLQTVIFQETNPFTPFGIVKKS